MPPSLDIFFRIAERMHFTYQLEFDKGPSKKPKQFRSTDKQNSLFRPSQIEGLRIDDKTVGEGLSD